MSFSNHTIYCAMWFFKSTIYGVSYYPVQRSKAISETVKGDLKGGNQPQMVSDSAVIISRAEIR